MMAPTSVVPPQISTSTSQPPHSPQSASPTTTRSRLRAFNFGRGHHHSTPQPTGPAPTETPTAMHTTLRQVSSNPVPASAEEQHNQTSSTTSWLPTVAGVSGLVRVPSAPTADSLATTEIFPNNTLFYPNHSNGGQSLGLDGSSDPRSAEETNGTNANQSSGNNTAQPAPVTTQVNGPDGRAPTIRFVPHVDPRSTRRPHTFAPMERSIRSVGDVVKVGRFSDRDNGNPVGFKSKVVSRRHCEFWWNEGFWYMKDVGSSSGTFLNHVRLSHPNTESKPYQVHDGDVVQLGIDFKGGEELIFRCVKMKLELNRDAKSINQFNVAAHRRIQNLGKPSINKAAGSDAHAGECAICLLNIAPCQSLFVAPCSHVWHYKCIRPILDASYPILPCPNCREIADVEAEIEDNNDDQWEDLDKIKEEPANDAAAGEASENGNTEAAAMSPEDRNKTPQPTTDIEDTTTAEGVTQPMHIPLGDLSITTLGSTSPHAMNGTVDTANHTPRNNAGPFILNGTTGRM